mmetsp:Transcript_51444/g.135036  ORF Transcript_51444/g.135036 Transcript_51444/m.135036 type:complete len:213 (+) Transcript_51444:257-895(+)
MGSGRSGCCARSGRTGGASKESALTPSGRAPKRSAADRASSANAADGGGESCCSGSRGASGRSSCLCRNRSSTSASCSDKRFERLSSSVNLEVISLFCCRTSSNCCLVSSSCLSISRSRSRRFFTISVCAASAAEALRRATMRSTRNCTRVSLSPHCFVVSLSVATRSALSCARVSLSSLSAWFSAVRASIRCVNSCSVRSTSSMCSSIRAT